jgi:hypothetical protein
METSWKQEEDMSSLSKFLDMEEQQQKLEEEEDRLHSEHMDSSKTRYL